jgi:hypothetical protein
MPPIVTKLDATHEKDINQPIDNAVLYAAS